MAVDPAWAAFLDRQAIEEALRRYCRGIDRSDAQMLKSVCHADATCDFGIFKGRFAEFADWMVEQLSDVNLCVHMISNISIELQGPVAFGETYCLSVTDAGDTHHIVYNRFIDRFEKRHDAWLIADRLVVFDVSRIEPATARYGGTMGDALTWGRKDREDASYRS